MNWTCDDDDAGSFQLGRCDGGTIGPDPDARNDAPADGADADATPD
jgi:hypothetical protein